MEISKSTTVLVTGASGGLGQAIARTLHQHDASVILTGRRVEPMQEIAKQTGARVLPCDLLDRVQVERLLDEAGPIDVLVANAGLPASGSILDFSPEEIDRAIDVNLRAPAVMARLLAPGMIERKRGQLIFISSMSGLIASASTPLYSATKFGLRGLSLGLRADLGPHGIGVTTVFPGFIRDAGMFAEAKVKLPRFVGTRSPDDVAEAVIDAILRNPAEIMVASPEQRLSAFVAAVAPGLVAALEKAFVNEAMVKSVVDNQRAKR
jgi:uncharacterized protein